ncbi:AraC family transcriptional regulator [Citrobacter sp. FP75]|uniref:AraC family transcriptional regulator n=1 Tax=Citrobacter sp. FP75 TaxID=1852949 RepID=UPI001BC8D1D0|nr:AraC family transcriptional regulator [Citrobacter sp. FP75]
MKKVNIQDKLNFTDTETIAIESIMTNKYLVIYTDNCDLTIQKNNETLFFPQRTFVFIERGIKFSCKIKKSLPGIKPYRVIRLDKKELVMLKDVFKATHSYYLDEKVIARKPHNKIIGVEGRQEYIEEFNRAESTTDQPLKILKLANIISRIGRSKEIINSLIVSAAITFTDKVRNMIEENTSRKWRLNMIADEFNISEVSVRKRLESEGTSFNNLLVEIRMNKAMQLLLENELQIHQISRDVGISSPSYFIKNFKDYFGITPKQFIIYFRS